MAISLWLAAAGSAEPQDFQSWNEVDLAGSWRRVDLLAPFVARVDPSLGNPQLAATGLTADVHLPLRLTLTPGYLFVDLPQVPARVHVPLLALTASVTAGRVMLADRNRVEKLIGYTGSPVRYRNRLLLDVPFAAAKRGHWFVDDEVLVNLSTASFNQNRFQVGAGGRLNERLGLDLYYLRRDPASGTATHALGCTLRVDATRRRPLLPSHTP